MKFLTALLVTLSTVSAHAETKILSLNIVKTTNLMTKEDLVSKVIIPLHTAQIKNFEEEKFSVKVEDPSVLKLTANSQMVIASVRWYYTVTYDNEPASCIAAEPEDKKGYCEMERSTIIVLSVPKPDNNLKLNKPGEFRT